MTQGIFNKDHYPTPEETIIKMCEGLILHNKNVLEPSTGAGRIVDHLNFMGANVIGCEIDEQLRILAQEKCRIIGNDFLDVKEEQVSHIDYIIMNPPFSADEKHIIHAFNIAPAGCVIRALCNYETISNAYTKNRKELYSIIHEFGSANSWGNAFMGEDSERSTRVEIGYIELKKPKPVGQVDDEFEGFYMDDEEEEQFNGLQQYNFVRDVVNRYVGAIKIFDEQLETAKRLSDTTGEFFSAKVGVAIVMGESQAKISREEYKKELQKSAWNWVFKKFNLEKYVTKSVKADINKFVEQNQAYPFTMRNVYKMIEILIGTVNHRMDKALIEVFESLTKHTHENRWNYEGFKTNSNYLVNEKFIMTSLFNMGGSLLGNGKMNVTWDGWRAEQLNDFIKALCYIEGINYDRLPSMHDFLKCEYYATHSDGSYVMRPNSYNKERFDLVSINTENLRWNEKKEKAISDFQEMCAENGYICNERPEWGKWFSFTFFEVKGYKKGTGHFKFKDRDVWARFNQQVARIMGFPLPDIRDEGSEKRSTKARKQKTKEYAGNN